MKYLAVLALLLLSSCGFLVRAEFESDDVKLEEVPDEAHVNAKRLVKPSTKIYIPLFISTTSPINISQRYSYCFKFRCLVPGMRNGVKGWSVQNSQGYVVVSGRLYRFYRCDVSKFKKYGR